MDKPARDVLRKTVANTPNSRFDMLPRQQTLALLAEMDRADEEREGMRAVLESVEWSAGRREYKDGESVGGSCPECRHERRHGHTSDCALAAALKGDRP